MAGYAVKTNGFDELVATLKDAPARLVKEVEGVFEKTAKTYVRNARRDAPKGVGFLAGQINYEHMAPLKFNIYSQSAYAGFPEFGTGKKVQILPGFEAQAAEVKEIKGGSAEEALENIKAWVRRKGIRFENATKYKSGKKQGQNKLLSLEDTAHIIFHFIMLNGIKPHPYFFPQVAIAEQNIEKDLKVIDPFK